MRFRFLVGVVGLDWVDCDNVTCLLVEVLGPDNLACVYGAFPKEV
jgi:hypothetical protein